MKAKLAALIARRKGIIDEFGEPAWSAFVEQQQARFPVLGQPMVATGSMPIDDFLLLNDEILKRFYKGNQRIYLDLGNASARWALTEGPYKLFRRSGIADFVKTVPAIWTTYFPEARASATAELDAKNVVHLRLLGLGMWHPYFEFLVVGYVQAGLEIVANKKVPTEKVLGGPGATEEIYYLFYP